MKSAAGVPQRLAGSRHYLGRLLAFCLVGLGLESRQVPEFISILFLAATGTLLLAIGGAGSMSIIGLPVSAAAMIHIQLGTMLGRWLLGRTLPTVFRGIVLCVLALGGLDMLRLAFF